MSEVTDFSSPTAEYGIQFVAQDVLPPERVRDVLELVRSTVIVSSSGKPVMVVVRTVLADVHRAEQ